MRSKINYKGHPLHPILVAFPIAFFTGAFFADAAGLFFGHGSLWNLGYWLQPAGVVFALLAAVPGIIDFIYVVPARSSANKRAAKHGLINAVVVIIFSAAWIIRSQNPAIIIVILDFAGFVLLLISGWLGGTLVYRNQIGVDHRYAHAGKWKERYFGESTSSLAVADSDELKQNQMMLLHIGKKRVVLARTENGYAAFDDFCTHRGGGLSDGSISCGIVQCPWHGSQFDVYSGEVKAGPAKEKIQIYSAYEENGKVFVRVQKKP